MTTRCKVASLLRGLAPTDRATLAGWLDNSRDSHGRRVSAVLLARAFEDLQRPVSPTALKDHRGGRCVCYREAPA